MVKLIFLILLSSCLNCFGFQSGNPEIIKINGKNYIYYQVENGDGWYAIARKFGISYVELRIANKEKDDKLFPGLKILVPANKLKVNDPFYQKNIPDKQISKTQELGNERYHIVGKGQTLFSIAKMYGVTVNELMEWNKLSNNSISIGQKLIVGEKSSDANITETKKEVVRKEEKPVEIQREDSVPRHIEKPESVSNNLDTSIVTSKVETEYVNYPKDTPSKPLENINTAHASETNPASEDSIADNITFAKSRREVNENGIAMVIDDEEPGPEKYFGLHATAPIGTIIRILNMTNSRKIYVKITGRLTDNSGVEGTIIKISKASADKLEATDKSFRVNLMYGVNKE